jgi:S1-C subfamily serine protease
VGDKAIPATVYIGEVVGVEVAIVTQAHEAKTLCFAISSNTAARIAEKIICHGHVKGG